MKNARHLFAALALTCALTASTYAGDISCGVTQPPPPPPSVVAEATAQGEMQNGVTAEVIAALLGLLSMF